MVLVGWMEPVLHGTQRFHFGLRSIVLGIFRSPFLFEENQALRGQLGTLLAHEETHRQLFQENERLRTLLRFQEQVPWRMTPAEVIGREWTPWLRTILLDRGTRDGIRVGMPIVTPTGLVGRISEVGSTASRVILMTDPHFRVAAAVSKTRVTGLVMGTSSGDLILTYVPLEAQFQPNEAVVTAGGRGFCPKGIPVGFIQAYRRDPLSMYHSIRLRPAVNLSAVEEVWIITWPSSNSGQ